MNAAAVDITSPAARGLDRLAALAAARGPELLAAASPSDWLYAHWYTEAGARPTEAMGGDLRPHLRAGLAASARWTPGWVVLQARDDGVCVAGKGPEVRELAPGDYGNLARPFMPPMPGDLLAVTARVDWSDPQTGFWHAQSPAGPPGGDLVRLYLSVEPLHAAGCLRLVTATLDDAAARYTLKCPSDAAAFSRLDSLVVYLEQAAWPGLEPAIAALGSRLALRADAPPLTCPLAPGLARIS